MTSVDTSPRDIKPIVARYKSLGLFGGLFFGAVVGVMVVGPNFREWSWLRSVATIAGSFGIGGIVGYFAGELAVAGLAGGPGGGMHSGTGHSSGGSGGLDASDSGSGGGDSGGGGGDS